MFDRLLGPRIDHEDPKVRAKAYAHDSIDESTLNAALASEQDGGALCVLLARATDVDAILLHAKDASGSIAGEARTRLVQLAASAAQASSEGWASVFRTAYAEQWTQTAALHDVLTRDQQESVVVGALSAQPATGGLDEPMLLTLATQSSSAQSRRLAAQRLTSESALERCCAELKDRDKTVYREVKHRLSERRMKAQRKVQADELQSELRRLGEQSIIAQPESVAVAQARRQTLEQRVLALSDEDAGLGAELQETLRTAVTEFDQRLDAARQVVSARKALKQRVAQAMETLNSAHDSSTRDALSSEELMSAWTALPDHSDLEQEAFDRDVRELARLLKASEADQDVYERLSARLSTWEEAAATTSPIDLLKQVEREWASCEKPQSETQLAELNERMSKLNTLLQHKMHNLLQKRAANTEQLLGILEQFSSTMEAGEFKKAMSLNDKLRARAANRELEPAARQRIEEALKSAQPKLEEFRKWRHFGTVQARENLIGQANTLISDPPASPKELAAKVKELRESWRKLDQDDGRASESVWQTFSRACKEAYKPAKKHFDQLSKERKVNLVTRKDLLAQLEALYEKTDWSAPNWIDVAKAHKALTLAWKRAGTIDYKVKKALYEAFDALEARFESHFKEEREHELERRKNLITRLKTLKDTETGGKLAAAAKRAQKEWRPTVQGPRKLERELWQEFRAVCDDIFGSLKQQRKDQKTAWQAEVAEREALCDQLDKLLLSDDDDGQAANLAKGQVAELAKQWRQRHQIPSGIAGKLDQRFKQARKRVETRIRQLHKEESQKHESELLARLEDCQKLEEAVLASTAQGASTATVESLFDGLKGAAAKHLAKRYAFALDAAQGDESAVETLRSSLSANQRARELLCLRGELVADIDSPESAQEARMKLKMERLTSAMQGELPSPSEELAAIIESWFLSGGVTAEAWPELAERFSRIQAARR